MSHRNEWLNERAIVSKAVPVYALGITTKATFGFSIAPKLGVTSGKITAIRVQDIATGKWFNWDGVAWDSPPVITPGAGNLYIAFWAVNQGLDGNLRLTMLDDSYTLLGDKTVLAVYNQGIGIEVPNLTMPARNYGISLAVSP